MFKKLIDASCVMFLPRIVVVSGQGVVVTEKYVISVRNKHKYWKKLIGLDEYSDMTVQWTMYIGTTP